MAETPKDVALLAKIEEQGLAVRTLKSANGDAKAVDEAVAQLLKLKEEYKALTGQDVPGASKGKPAKKKDAKEEGEAAAKEPKEAKGGKGKKGKSEAKEGAGEEAAAPKGDEPISKRKAKAAEKPADGNEVKEDFSFPAAEEEILKFWEEIEAFKTSLKFSEGKPEYTFYDGPPFATGTPHYGHILAGTIKDVMTRYAHQTGHHVERRFGWDCHGLPVEYEIDKALNIKGPQDVLAMGIDKYNGECRKIVMRYSQEWEDTVTRLGRWIDFKNDYKTMYPWFMESVWWVFKQMFEKGLVYRGFKVMPFSTALSTPLSNFEANQDMKNVQDPAVTVAFKSVDGDYSYLAWTTTPWTLPSNLALCVHPEVEYVRFRDNTKNAEFVCAKPLLKGKGCLYKEDDTTVEILAEFLGATLVGKKYTPLFPYFQSRADCFRIVSDTYVTTDTGTGIVHQAPGHGEDDFRVCLAHKIINNEDIPCPIDESGRFTEEVPEYKGMYIKDADKEIIKALKASGKMFHESTVFHAYPHCWRSSTPLIRKTVDSWFVRVEGLRERLMKNNQQTYWVPSAIKEGRFHNWLSEARDWAISRNRFWGTPIPLWISDDGQELVCVGSIEELQELSGRTDVTDLHREYVDPITIPSKQGKGLLKRVPQVFDCWFESGSMPYAQKHYPFENKDRFEKGFPADFIAEGLDQTRGWFYTLLVIGTCLFDQPPWKNLVVNGLILAGDGQKMSKRLRNYPPPTDVLKENGADALRLYLVDSPAVRAESLRFNQKGVQDLTKDVFLPWLNAFRFFEQNAKRLQEAIGSPFLFDPSARCESANTFDRWILAYAQTLIKFFHEEMQAYRLYTVLPRLLKFIDNLTNWYIRFNRKRLKGQSGDDDAWNALWTLGEVLLSLSKLMAPVTPFFTEWVYQRLRPYLARTMPVQWTPAQVTTWLTESGLGQHVALFQQHGIKGVDLFDLSHADLTSMGLDRCTDRKAILRSTAQLIAAHPTKEVRVINNVSEEDSVHFQMLPQPKEEYYNSEIERGFDALKRTIEAGRLIRDRNTLPVKYPLRELVVVSKTPFVVDDVVLLSSYIKAELNIQTLTVCDDPAKYHVQLRAEAKADVLGPRLQGAMRTVVSALQQLTQEQLEAFQKSGTVSVAGHELTASDVLLTYEFAAGTQTTYSAFTDADILVLLDVTPTQEMIDEGIAREVVSRVQKLRKKAKLQPSDPITVTFQVVKEDPATNLGGVLAAHSGSISAALDGQAVAIGAPEAGAKILGEEDTKIKAADLKIWIVARS
eukprot:m.226316 g.226316  ORF g.226316 m.226316 type:complete len:1277 (-) comp11410_c0_seq1:49-3879(-)